MRLMITISTEHACLRQETTTATLQDDCARMRSDLRQYMGAGIYAMHLDILAG